MPTLLEKRTKRAQLIADARKIQDAADKEKRSLSKEEESSFDKYITESDALKLEIEKEERDETRRNRLIDLEREMSSSAGRATQADDEHRIDPNKPDRRGGSAPTETRWKSRNGVERVVRHAGLAGTEDYRGACHRWLQTGDPTGMRKARQDWESRGLQADIDVEGGFLIGPTQMVAGILKNVDDMLFVRQHATVIIVNNAQSLGQVTLDTDMDDGEWTSEIKTGSEDTATRFGKRELHPHPLAKRIKISETLIRKAPDIEGFVNERLAYRIALTEEKAFLTGSGNKRPLGVFTASDDGIPTSRDIQTGSATDITADGLIDCRYSLKEQYIREARWLFHRDGIKRVAKLKDGEGQYLWRPGLVADQPDRILNIPVDSSEHAPNTFTTGQYVGGLFCWRWYYIAQNAAIALKRLNELYAETNQIGIISRTELDGMPVLAEAFSRLKTN